VSAYELGQDTMEEAADLASATRLSVLLGAGAAAGAAIRKLRLFAANDCQARATLRSMLWSIPSRKRIPGPELAVRTEGFP
jgi:hypothetical protein